MTTTHPDPRVQRVIDAAGVGEPTFDELVEAAHRFGDRPDTARFIAAEARAHFERLYGPARRALAAADRLQVMLEEPSPHMTAEEYRSLGDAASLCRAIAMRTRQPQAV